jgi:regulator of RNase E activity RraA
VEVFGRKVQPGQLIHADKHGFIVIPDEDVDRLLDAAIFMDNNECNTLIAAARNATGKPVNQILKELNDASAEFGKAVKDKFR